MNTELSEVVAEVLQNYSTNVKTAQARHLVKMMSENFKFFKSSFLTLIDKILVIEEKDQLIKNVYTLISKFYIELLKM